MNYFGSQKLNSLNVSHFLYQNKLYFEIIILCITSYAGYYVFKQREKFLPTFGLVLAIIAYYFFNFYHTAENRFHQPKNLLFASNTSNTVPTDTPAMCVEIDGTTKAYPIPFARYHHQIIDTLGGKTIIITYCGLCRTGRVYEPIIKNKYSKFRLVGLNRLNALFEDEKTKSWWSQETGECIVGKLKGERLPEVYFNTMSLYKWIELYPDSKIMQPDSIYLKRYQFANDYNEDGENSEEPITDGTWADYSFVVGIVLDKNRKAYEWNTLLKKKIINDRVANKNVCVALSSDNKSFIAFENTSQHPGIIKNDTLFVNKIPYNFKGINLTNSQKELKLLPAYREYWFSWKYAYPDTDQYKY